MLAGVQSTGLMCWTQGKIVEDGDFEKKNLAFFISIIPLYFDIALHFGSYLACLLPAIETHEYIQEVTWDTVMICV